MEMTSTSDANFMLFAYQPVVCGSTSAPTDVNSLVESGCLPPVCEKMELKQRPKQTAIATMECQFHLVDGVQYGGMYSAGAGLLPVSAYCRNQRLGSAIADVTSYVSHNSASMSLDIVTKKRKILLSCKTLPK